LGAGVLDTLANLLRHTVIVILWVRRKSHRFRVGFCLDNALPDHFGFGIFRQIRVELALQFLLAFLGGRRRFWMFTLKGGALTCLLNLSLNGRRFAIARRRRIGARRQGQFMGNIFGHR